MIVLKQDGKEIEIIERVANYREREKWIRLKKLSVFDKILKTESSKASKYQKLKSKCLNKIKQNLRHSLTGHHAEN